MILLVEDNADDEALTIRALRRQNIGNKIIVVHDGQEALEFLFCTGAYADRNPSEEPQLILLDLNLPKVGGLEVLRRLRADERTYTLPVAILTSSEEEKDLIDGYQLGINAYIRKPVEFNEFLEAAHQLGLFWLVLNKNAPLLA